MAKSENHLGRLFMVGLQGESITPIERKVINDIRPAGLTLFARNLRTIEQIIALVSDIQKLWKDEPPIIAIDQEGGEKERLPVPPFTHWPGNRLLGDIFARTASDHTTRIQYQAIAKELGALGINTNFTPVADVVPGTTPSFMDKRAFAASPETVAALSAATVETLLQNNMIPCLKHFPGHGATHVDSHLKLPTIEKSLEKIWHSDLVPFRRGLEAGAPLVMTGHLNFPALDRDLPTTLSPATITGLLRQRLGFSGLIVSDDLSMMAITHHFEATVVAEKAVLAGVDLLLYCEGVENAATVFDHLCQSRSLGSTLDSTIEATSRRIAAWKGQYLKNIPQPDIEAVRELTTRGEHRRLAQEIAQKAKK